MHFYLDLAIIYVNIFGVESHWEIIQNNVLTIIYLSVTF